MQVESTPVPCKKYIRAKSMPLILSGYMCGISSDGIFVGYRVKSRASCFQTSRRGTRCSLPMFNLLFLLDIFTHNIWKPVYNDQVCLWTNFRICLERLSQWGKARNLVCPHSPADSTMTSPIPKGRNKNN